MKMLLSRFILILIIAFSAHNLASGQEKVSPKAMKYFEKAVFYYQGSAWADCEKELLKAIAEDPQFPDPHIMLGDVYLETGKVPEAIDQYKHALDLKPEKENQVMSLLANTLFNNERYSEAAEYYEKLLGLPSSRADDKAWLQKKLEESKFRQNLMENPVAFHPVNLGPSVNSSYDEYINALAADGSGIYFTRRSKNTGTTGKDFIEDLYFAGFSADSTETAEKLTYPPGKENDAGGLCISPDGRLLFFTACFRADGYGSCDLYFSEKTGDEWSEARNLGNQVNSEAWEAQPSISPDGSTLYFASNRKGGAGSSDLWKTQRNAEGEWTKPMNLGSPVNTAAAEMAPFIHFDNQALYFSSAGHMGLGGADLFKSTRSGNGWAVPQNLGYPINSKDDELVIIINPEGDLGYISSFDMTSGRGYDIYRFQLPDDIKPVAVTYLKGKVYDRDTRLPLEASFSLIDIEKDSLIIGAMSDRINGEFLVCLPGNRDYALNVSCDGYLFYSDHFPLSEIKSSLDPVLKNIPMEPVAVGNSMVLRNIFFDTDQFELKTASFPELDKLVKFLADNPSIRIEIGGHTDNEGSEEYNEVLSRNRANSVYSYLVDSGLPKKECLTKGMVNHSRFHRMIRHKTGR
jgi:tetratricopeptide (TPR) repeat protein